MKKRVIIISIICGIIALIALAAIIFSAVFRVKHVTVDWVGERITITADEEQHPITDEEIVASSKIKKGSSTLFLNKDEATKKLEQAYPYLRVLQIRLTGAKTVELRLTARHEMFYYTREGDGYFYILDEELKVLDRVDKTKTARIENLVEIKPYVRYYDNAGQEQINPNILQTGEQTHPGDFLGKEYRQIFNSLYIAMYRTVLVNPDGSLWLGKTTESDVKELLKNTIRNFEREDLTKVLNSVEIKYGYTHTGSHLRLVLNTVAGVVIDIAKPETGLEGKINNCFSFASMLDGDVGEGEQPNTETTSSSGRVAFEYDLDGNSSVRYYPASN